MNLSDLKSVLAPLSEIGKDEFTFSIDGATITVRPLLPHEEVAVQKYSASILDSAQEEEGASMDDHMSRAAALDYFDRFRIEVVAHAVCQINDNDLRGVDYIETGETLSNGKPIRVPRYVAMRDLITNTWSRSMITICFGKYGELVTKLAEKADSIGKESIPDIEIEMSRVSERLSELENEKNRRSKGDPGIMEGQIQSLVAADEQMKKDVQNAVRVARAVTQSSDIEPPPEIDPIPSRKPESQPSEASPPTVEEESDAVTTAPPPTPEAEAPTDPSPDSAPPPVRESVIPQNSPPPTQGQAPPAYSEVMSSFQDPDDEGVIEAEEQRILRARRQAVEAQQQALNDGDLVRDAAPIGKIKGIEAYRLPSQTLSARGEDESPKGGRASVNKVHRGELNPNFKKSE